MVDSGMLEVLALVAVILLVVVGGGLVLEYGTSNGITGIAQLWDRPTPTPLVAVTTPGTVFGVRDESVARAFPTVKIEPSVSIFAPVLEPAVPESNGLSITGYSLDNSDIINIQ